MENPNRSRKRALGEKSAMPNLRDALPTIAVVGAHNSGKSSVVQSIVGKDFLPLGSGIVTRRPLVLQLHKIEENREWGEFMHLPQEIFSDFAAVRKEIADETDRVTGGSKQISTVPIHLSIFSPNVVNLTLIDLPGLTKVAVDGQSETIVQDIENMIRAFIKKPNCIILAVSPANQDLATSDAIKISLEVDPKGERTFGVLTKVDLMDKGTDAVDIFEGRENGLQFPWVGVVNRRKEREFWANSPEYRHLAHRMGSEYLAKILSEQSHTRNWFKKQHAKGNDAASNSTDVQKRLRRNRSYNVNAQKPQHTGSYYDLVMALPTYFLFELASGYALLLIHGLDQVVTNDYVSIDEYISHFDQVVKLVAYYPFKSADDAMQQCEAISEGKVTNQLMTFLISKLPKVAFVDGLPCYALALAHPGMVGPISHKMCICCVSGIFLDHIFTGIRIHIGRFMSDHKPEVLVKAQKDLARLYNRKAKVHV